MNRRKILIVLILMNLFSCDKLAIPEKNKKGILYTGLSKELEVEVVNIHQKLIGDWKVYTHQCDQYCNLTEKEFKSYYGHVFTITQDHFYFPCTSIQACKDSEENPSDRCDIEEMYLADKTTVAEYSIINHDNLTGAEYGDNDDDLYILMTVCGENQTHVKFSDMKFNPVKETFSMEYNDNVFFLKKVKPSSVDKPK